MIKPSPLDLAYKRKVGPVPWPRFRDEIAPDFSPPKRSPAYGERFNLICRIMEGVGVESTSDLNLAMVDLVIAGRPPGQSKFTLQSILVMIRTICSHAVRLRYLEVSPFTVKPVSKFVRPGRPKGKQHLTRAEITRLMDLLRNDIATRTGWGKWKSRRLYIVVCLGLYCGLRRNELLRLQVQDIDLPNRLIRLVAHNKTGKLKTEGSEQPVPIAEALVPILQEWLAHRLDHPRDRSIDLNCPWLIPTIARTKPWDGGSGDTRALHQLKRAAGRAGIDGRVTLHMLRKSCATHLESMGVPRSMITRILRHSGGAVTEHFYLMADEANMVDAVKAVVF